MERRLRGPGDTLLDRLAERLGGRAGAGEVPLDDSRAPRYYRDMVSTNALVVGLAERLGAQGYRVTGARRQVLAAVLRREAPFTAQDLVAELAPRGVGRATVFRTLDLLARLGVLNRIHADDRQHRYTVCDGGHHHHLVCRACGDVAEIVSDRLETEVRLTARANGFRPLGHSVEIYGICRSCQQSV